MSQPDIPYRIFQLGDTALTLEFGNRINETINGEVINRFNQLIQAEIQGIADIIPAYSTVSIIFDPTVLYKQVQPGQTVFEWMRSKLERILIDPVTGTQKEEELIRIPVCYDPEFGPDLLRFSAEKGLSPTELIHIHCAKTYKIYMMGFLPGFAYMGEVDERISGPRKLKPETVVPGSVGIAGRQTGIYPLESPGGWQIIGRTPLKLFDATNPSPVLLKSGQPVRFFPVTKIEFEEWDKQNETDKTA